MSWFGKLMFGSLGLFVGGPLGAILGGVVGHHLIDKHVTDINTHQSGLNVEQAQAAYFVCLFSIFAKLAKIDGVVTQDEIKVVENIIQSMNIGQKEQQFARRIFTEAKNSPYSIDDFARQFYQLNQHNPAVLASFLDVLFRLAAADGKLHPSEEHALKRIKNIFNISDQKYNEIRAAYFDDTDKYYKMLNCTPDSTNEDIRKNYKKLVKEFHPDTIVSKGLPEEFTEFAAKRFREIQEAYEKVRKERHF